METEIEAKFANINPKKIRKRLIDLGAKLRTPERLMRRKNYDYPDGRLKKIGGWIRLRDEIGKVTLAYKQVNNRTIHGTQEISIIVGDFEQTAKLLTTIGLEMKSYQETKRESWLFKNTEIEIDTWPWIPSFVEIEGNNEKTVRQVSKSMGLQWKDARHGSVENIYQEVFDVTEEEIDAWKTITFSPVPKWLEQKRRG